jgi:hypothetical protein
MNRSVIGRRGLEQESEKCAPKVKQFSRVLEALIIVHDISDDLSYICSGNCEQNAESLFSTCPYVVDRREAQ